MNLVQIRLETYQRAAYLARFEPAGKPFKAACETIEKMERSLRSISMLATGNDGMSASESDLLRKIAAEALNNP